MSISGLYSAPLSPGSFLQIATSVASDVPAGVRTEPGQPHNLHLLKVLSVSGLTAVHDQGQKRELGLGSDNKIGTSQ